MYSVYFFLPVNKAVDVPRYLICETHFVLAVYFVNVVKTLTPTADETRINWHKTIFARDRERERVRFRRAENNLIFTRSTFPMLPKIIFDDN